MELFLKPAQRKHLVPAPNFRSCQTSTYAGCSFTCVRAGFSRRRGAGVGLSKFVETGFEDLWARSTFSGSTLLPSLLLDRVVVNLVWT